MKSLISIDFPNCPKCDSQLCSFLNEKVEFECGSEYYRHDEARFSLGRPCRVRETPPETPRVPVSQTLLNDQYTTIPVLFTDDMSLGRITCPWCGETHTLMFAEGKPLTQGLKSSPYSGKNPAKHCYIHVDRNGTVTFGQTTAIYRLGTPQ